MIHKDADYKILRFPGELVEEQTATADKLRLEIFEQLLPVDSSGRVARSKVLPDLGQTFAVSFLEPEFDEFELELLRRSSVPEDVESSRAIDSLLNSERAADRALGSNILSAIRDFDVRVELIGLLDDPKRQKGAEHLLDMAADSKGERRNAARSVLNMLVEDGGNFKETAKKLIGMLGADGQSRSDAEKIILKLRESSRRKNLLDCLDTTNSDLRNTLLNNLPGRDRDNWVGALLDEGARLPVFLHLLGGPRSDEFRAAFSLPAPERDVLVDLLFQAQRKIRASELALLLHSGNAEERSSVKAILAQGGTWKDLPESFRPYSTIKTLTDALLNPSTSEWTKSILSHDQRTVRDLASIFDTNPDTARAIAACASKPENVDLLAPLFELTYSYSTQTINKFFVALQNPETPLRTARIRDALRFPEDFEGLPLKTMSRLLEQMQDADPAKRSSAERVLELLNDRREGKDVIALLRLEPSELLNLKDLCKDENMRVGAEKLKELLLKCDDRITAIRIGRLVEACYASDEEERGIARSFLIALSNPDRERACTILLRSLYDADSRCKSLELVWDERLRKGLVQLVSDSSEDDVQEFLTLMIQEKGYFAEGKTFLRMLTGPERESAQRLLTTVGARDCLNLMDLKSRALLSPAESRGSNSDEDNIDKRLLLSTSMQLLHSDDSKERQAARHFISMAGAYYPSAKNAQRCFSKLLSAPETSTAARSFIREVSNEGQLETMARLLASPKTHHLGLKLISAMSRNDTGSSASALLDLAGGDPLRRSPELFDQLCKAFIEQPELLQRTLILAKDLQGFYLVDLLQRSAEGRKTIDGMVAMKQAGQASFVDLILQSAQDEKQVNKLLSLSKEPATAELIDRLMQLRNRSDNPSYNARTLLDAVLASEPFALQTMAHLLKKDLSEFHQGIFYKCMDGEFAPYLLPYLLSPEHANSAEFLVDYFQSSGGDDVQGSLEKLAKNGSAESIAVLNKVIPLLAEPRHRRAAFRLLQRVNLGD